MNRAFVKDQDTTDTRLPDRPVSEHPNYVTASGLAQLERARDEAQSRLKALEDRGEQIEAAAERMAIERDLRWLDKRIGGAIRVDPAAQPRDRVAFGATVTVAGPDGERRYRIVGEDQADAERGWVSHVSPLAKALLGARVDDEVEWKRPAGDLTLEIRTIDYAD